MCYDNMEVKDKLVFDGIRKGESMIEYNEDVYKRVTGAGVVGIVIGVIAIVVGITIGVVSIVHGGLLLKARKGLLD